jgi:hypothetical protein
MTYTLIYVTRVRRRVCCLRLIVPWPCSWPAFLVFGCQNALGKTQSGFTSLRLVIWLKNYEVIWIKQTRNRPAIYKFSKKFRAGLIDIRFSYYIASGLPHLLALLMRKTLCLKVDSVRVLSDVISEFSGVAVWRCNPCCRVLCGVVLLFLCNILHSHLS